MAQQTLVGREIVGGAAEGRVLYADTGLSFWGGCDPQTGVIVDHTHPLHNECVCGRVLAIPNGRGSCTGSQVVLELLLNGVAPAALLLRTPDVILSLGVIVAEELFGHSIPIVSLGDSFDRLEAHTHAAVAGSTVICGAGPLPPAPRSFSTADERLAASALQLEPEERAMLAGERGRAARVAMRVVARAAEVCDAERLLRISQAHIDGCTYIGPGGLRFARELVALGGRVAVPTTLNSNSVDRRRWRAMGVPASLGEPSEALGQAYLDLGASLSFTCSPYLLPSAPRLGEHVAWGESNAVVFANSVLGARTLKYADYLDICAALVGRAPAAGAHLDEHRHATLVLDASALS
uniref:Aconitase X catalytic domain-containing protein n=1 Tax=Emiliania huxleyi TaxID=2903 RepID=A0A7S3SIT8_EMIHU